MATVAGPERDVGMMLERLVLNTPVQRRWNSSWTSFWTTKEVLSYWHSKKWRPYVQVVIWKEFNFYPYLKISDGLTNISWVFADILVFKRSPELKKWFLEWSVQEATAQTSTVVTFSVKVYMLAIWLYLGKFVSSCQNNPKTKPLEI